jgi:phosphomannomutase
MSIFKAYDIRGIYPEELDEDWAYKIGRAFAAFIQEESGKDNPKVFLSRDNRLSSPSLYEEAKKGMMDQGVTVVAAGLATTPMLYFGVSNYGFDGGMSVTASHNPGKYNGFKMVREKAIPVGEASGLKKIEQMANSSDFGENKEGEISEISILDDYVKANSFPADYGFSVMVDTANGIAGLPSAIILGGDSFTSIFPELDGNFPNHDPDPLKEGNLDALCKRVVEEKAVVGIAFDGDGDRVFFVDEKGVVVSCDLITALVSEVLLRREKGLRLLYDIRCSNIVKETIESNGGVPMVGRVGHTFIKEKMRQEDIFFAGEYSGHFYFKDSAYAENPFSVVRIVLDEIKRTGLPFSEIVAKYRKYYHSGEMNFKVIDKVEKINQIRAAYSNGALSELDGIRVDHDDWWFLVRGSNTEPLLRIIVEAETKELLDEKVVEMKRLMD